MPRSPDAMSIPELVSLLTPTQKASVTDYLRRLVKKNEVVKSKYDRVDPSTVRLSKPSKSNYKPATSIEPSSDVTADTSSTIMCKPCNRSFAALEDLQRHYNTKHLKPKKSKPGEVGRRPLGGGLCNGR